MPLRSTRDAPATAPLPDLRPNSPQPINAWPHAILEYIRVICDTSPDGTGTGGGTPRARLLPAHSPLRAPGEGVTADHGSQGSRGTLSLQFISQIACFHLPYPATQEARAASG
jgi:hypothetical protein